MWYSYYIALKRHSEVIFPLVMQTCPSVLFLHFLYIQWTLISIVFLLMSVSIVVRMSDVSLYIMRTARSNMFSGHCLWCYLLFEKIHNALVIGYSSLWLRVECLFTKATLRSEDLRGKVRPWIFWPNKVNKLLMDSQFEGITELC